MRKLLAVAVTVVALWCGTAQALPTWTAMGPGGGGAFTSVSVNDQGANNPGDVLVGSDVSGLYYRAAGGTTWTRIGGLNGLTSTIIYNVKWAPHHPNIALCSTGDGLFRTTDNAATWSRVNGTNMPAGTTAGAIGWGPVASADSAKVFVAAENLALSKSTDNGATWSSFTSPTNANTFPIKIVWNSTYLWVLGGQENGKGTARDLLYTFTPNGQVNWYSLPTQDATAANPIDIALCPGNNNHFAIARSDNSALDQNSSGTVYRCNYNGTFNWTQQSFGGPAVTGALWYLGTDQIQILNVQQDIGSSRAGIWDDSDNNNTFTQIDDGQGTKYLTSAWDAGWTALSRAYGQPFTNVANGISEHAEYRVTSQFVWQYIGGSTRHYEAAFGSHDGSTPPTATTYLLDNANAATIELNGSALWAGYYDLGLWKWTGSTWENHNDTHWGWATSGNAYGGAVNGILFNGSNVYVSAATDGSSKGGTYGFYTSSSSGAYNSFSYFDSTGHYPDHAFINSLTAGNGKYWASFSQNGSTSDRWCGQIRSGTDFSSSVWSNTVIGDTGMMVVKSHASTVLVGGWRGLYRSTDNGSTWAQVSSIRKPTKAGEVDYASLHKHKWNGVTDIYYSPAGVWWVSCYAPADTTCQWYYTGGQWVRACDRGFYYSTDDGATFTLFGGRNGPGDVPLARAVAADSCGGTKVHLVTGQGFSSPVNGDGLASSLGCTACVDDYGTISCATEVPQYATAQWGTSAAHTIRIYDVGDGHSKVYVIAPGYGVQTFTQYFDCLEGLGSGDLSGAHRTREEGVAPKLPRTMFSIADAWALIKEGQLELYDVSGRKARTPSSGVYFVIERNKAGAVTARRAVLVTP